MGEEIIFQDFRIAEIENSENIWDFQSFDENEIVFYHLKDFSFLEKSFGREPFEDIYFTYNGNVYGKDSNRLANHVYLKNNKILYTVEKEESLLMVYEGEEFGKELASVGFPFLITESEDIIYSSKSGEGYEKKTSIIKNREEILKFDTSSENILITFEEVNNSLYFLFEKFDSSTYKSTYEIINQDKEKIFNFSSEDIVSISQQGSKFLIENNFQIEGVDDLSKLKSLDLKNNLVYIQIKENSIHKLIILNKNNQILFEKNIENQTVPLYFYNNELYEAKILQGEESFQIKLIKDGIEFRDSFQDIPKIGVYDKEILIGARNEDRFYLLRIR